MTVIRGRQILSRQIKECLWSTPDEEIQFPKTMYFCDKMGAPTFKITIEKTEEDTFVDDNGQKWIKCRN